MTDLFRVEVEDAETASRVAASADFQKAGAALEIALTKLRAIASTIPNAELGPAIEESFGAAVALQKRVTLEVAQAWGEALVAEAFAKGFDAGKDLQPPTPPPVVVNFDPGAITATIALPDAPLRVQVEGQPTMTRARLIRDASGAVAGIETVQS